MDRARSAGIIEYVQGEMRPFSAKPLCEVDSLVFSTLAYFNWAAFDAVPDKFPAHQWFQRTPRLSSLFRSEKFKGLLPDSDSLESEHYQQSWTLFASLCSSPRFRDVRVTTHISIFDKTQGQQFSVTTFGLPGGGVYVAFRGTTDSLTAWRESFNLAFVSPVPSQRSALSYLENVLDHTKARVYVGGHSKGGNLAIYAAAMLPENLQQRVFAVYSHDGPGFPSEVLESPGFKAISPRIHKTVPESSIIGMLLENREPLRVVQSRGRSGVEQHSPYSWIVEDGDFIRVDKLTRSSHFFDATLDKWVAELSIDQRQLFTDALFDMFEAAGARSIDDLKPADMLSHISFIREMDAELRGKLIEVVKKLIAESARNLLPSHDDKHAR